jgi:threonine dehydrogenase-like Zn-dependent dehydrogenase
MRASFYQGNRTFTTGAAPMPVPAAGEALLRIRRVGICGSDLHIFQGHLDHRVPKGNTIGHEVLAEVVSSPSPPAIASSSSPSCTAARAARVASVRRISAIT